MYSISLQTCIKYISEFETVLFCSLIVFFLAIHKSTSCALKSSVLSYLILLDEESAFKGKFLRFGPSEDSKFLHMKCISKFLLFNSFAKIKHLFK